MRFSELRIDEIRAANSVVAASLRRGARTATERRGYNAIYQRIPDRVGAARVPTTCDMPDDLL